MYTRTCAAASAALCRHAGSPPRASRRPGRGGTAATSGPRGAAPGRSRRRGGSHRRPAGRRQCPASSVHRGPGVSPQPVVFRQPNGQAGDAPGSRRPAGLVAFARVVPSGGQSAMPGQDGRGRHGKIAVHRLRGMKLPARRTSSGRSARTVPGRCDGAAPRSRAGVPAAQHPSPRLRGTPGQSGRIASASADKRS
jgi:hypothetical protein